MSYQKDPNKLENEARIIGYLKESALKEARDDKTREEIISGTITLIADNDMEFRLYCYARRYRKLRQGETTPQKNGNYDKLAELLPTRATSLAGILAQDQTATFENSKSLLTKVFCVAELGERFYYGRDNEVHETIDIRPVTVMKANEQYFRPTASFTCDVFVNGIHPEKKNGEDTGRYVIDGSMLRYDGTTINVPFVTNGTAVVNGAVEGYSIGDTTTLKGNLVRMENRRVVSGPSNGFVGEDSERVITEFVDERVVTQCKEVSRPEGEPKTYVRNEILQGNVLRQEQIDAVKKAGPRAQSGDNGAVKPTTATAHAASAAPAAANTATFNGGATKSDLTNFDGIDF